MASVLTAHRTKRSLTLEACAHRAKITPSRLERIESGAGHLYLDDLFGLAEAFRLRPSTLMKRIDEAVR
ncbi:MAG: helix-turn-helix domain-containing protein [Blastocatellales bacterium]